MFSAFLTRHASSGHPDLRQSTFRSGQIGQLPLKKLERIAKEGDVSSACNAMDQIIGRAASWMAKTPSHISESEQRAAVNFLYTSLPSILIEPLRTEAYKDFRGSLAVATKYLCAASLLFNRNIPEAEDFADFLRKSLVFGNFVYSAHAYSEARTSLTNAAYSETISARPRIEKNAHALGNDIRLVAPQTLSLVPHIVSLMYDFLPNNGVSIKHAHLKENERISQGVHRSQDQQSNLESMVGEILASLVNFVEPKMASTVEEIKKQLFPVHPLSRALLPKLLHLPILEHRTTVTKFLQDRWALSLKNV